MTRQIGICMAFVVGSLLCAGCPDEPGVRLIRDGREPDVIVQAGMPFRVDNWSRRILSGPDGDPGKRRAACTAVIREAKNADLSGEMKARLIDDLTKMVQTEQMSDATPEMKEEIILEGNKAIAALQ